MAVVWVPVVGGGAQVRVGLAGLPLLSGVGQLRAQQSYWRVVGGDEGVVGPKKQTEQKRRSAPTKKASSPRRESGVA